MIKLKNINNTTSGEIVEVKNLKIEYGVNITQAHVAILIRNLNGSCDFFN
tara:strand:+ start:309 stop:458 length:150 start_codon:yes stop_codon:yes gene_type:complete